MKLWQKSGNFGNKATTPISICHDFTSKSFPGQIDIVIRAYNKSKLECQAMVQHINSIADVIPNIRGILLVIDSTASKGGEHDGSTAKNFNEAWQTYNTNLDLAVGHLTVEGDLHQREWTRDLNAAYVFLREHSEGDHSLLFLSSEAVMPREELSQLCDALRTHTPFVTLRDTPDALSPSMARLRRRYGGRWKDALPLLSAGYSNHMPDPDATLMVQICDRNTFCLWRGSEIRDIRGFDSFCNALGGMEDVHARRVLSNIQSTSIPDDAVVIRYYDTRLMDMTPEQIQQKKNQCTLEHKAVLRICMHDPIPTPIERQDFQIP